MDIATQLARVLAGERSAFEPIVQHFQNSLFAYLGRMGCSQAQAEELAQETFLRAWQHLPEYDAKRAAFSTWLFTIAHRLALNELTKLANRCEIPLADETMSLIAANTPTPVEQLQTQQQQKQLQRALLRLNLTERSAIALAYVQGLDLKTIAQIEGCSEAALKVRLHRAKQQLREWLELP